MARPPKNQLARELERALPPGWRRAGPDDDPEDVCFARALADGLELGLEVFADEDGAIVADVEVSHPKAQRWLLAARKGIPVAIVWELAEAAGRAEPLAWRSPDLVACAAEVATLAADATVALEAKAGTRDAFIAALRADPDRAAQLDDILVALDAGDEPPPAPADIPAAPSWRETRARMKAQRDALAAARARGLADADARAVAIEEELAARGLSESPLWIRRRAEGTEVSSRTWLRDVAKLVGRLRADEPLTDDLPAPGAGPWLEVTLVPGAEAVLAAAYADAQLRFGQVATVAAELRCGAAALQLVLGGATVGQVGEATPDLAGTVPVQAKIGRLAAERFLVQVRLPRG